MKIETWIQAVSTVGFPIVISFYVLGRLEPTINRLNETIRLQSIIIARQTGIDYDSIVQEYGGE
mgnify:FL=1